jgi:hypothetical protein
MSVKTALIGVFALAMFATAAWVAVAPFDDRVEFAMPFQIQRN